MQLVFSITAAKQFLKLDTTVQKRIKTELFDITVHGYKQDNNIKALKGSNTLRLRVGDYRVIFTIEGKILTVIKIGHRRDVYE